jgi:hypothetical protein
VSALGWLAIILAALSVLASGMAAYWSIQARREYRKLAAIYAARHRERLSDIERAAGRCELCGVEFEVGVALAAGSTPLGRAVHRRCAARVAP